MNSMLHLEQNQYAKICLKLSMQKDDRRMATIWQDLGDKFNTNGLNN